MLLKSLFAVLVMLETPSPLMNQVILPVGA